MLMADTMAIFFVVLGFLLALPALWLLCSGLWPDAVFKSYTKTNRNLIKPFLAGIPVTGVVLLIAVAMKNVFAGLGNIGAGALVCLYVVYASAGVAGLTTTIGRRLKSPPDAEQPWRATLRGSIVLVLTYLLPILGWFVILPASMIIGAGAVTMSLFHLKPAQSPMMADANGPRVAPNAKVTADLP